MIHRKLVGLLLAAGVLGAMAAATAAPAQAAAPTATRVTAVAAAAKETPAQKANRLAKHCLKKGVSGAEIVCIAKSQVGMKEWGSNCNPYTSRCEEWCGDFAAWVMKKAGGKAPSGYPAAAAWRKWKKVGTPKPGDVAVRSDGNHVEVVVGVSRSGGKLVVASIGGNSGNKVTYHSNNSYARWTYHNNPSF
ncbi:CHAP domain-containing protein [Fodinicola acaciae]|uniref:CHAP domain-containing protein n=1 Tax=Fodinicola acaciae TaxID=2681555 RepID=UPI0013CF9F6F|nr:CHAP domain-containing protein [Fodinicola acaciae]